MGSPLMLCECSHPTPIANHTWQGSPCSRSAAGWRERASGCCAPRDAARLWSRLARAVPALGGHTPGSYPGLSPVASRSRWQSLFDSSLGMDALLLLLDLLAQSPWAGKWSVKVLLSVLILRGHKIVRAIVAHINKTLCACQAKRKKIMKVLKEKLQYHLGLIRQFLQGALLFFWYVF